MVMRVVRAVFIDTNILIRSYIAEAEFHTECLQAVQQLRIRHDELWISRQVLREYISVVTRPQGFVSLQPIETVVQDLHYIQTHFRVADETFTVTRNLLRLLEQIPMGGKQVHDANIVATMLAYGLRHLLTLNTGDFARLSEQITIISLENIQQDRTT